MNTSASDAADECGIFKQLPSLRHFRAFQGGLVPTESSSGQRRVQGSITKAGNTHARRLLVEAAWHHRRQYRTPGATMRARWKLASSTAQARGHAGNHRLHQRWQALLARQKKPVVANVAVARELAGWCWSLAVLDQ